MSADTTIEAVDRAATLIERNAITSGQYRAAATLRALAAERDALRAEVQRAQASEREACHETLQQIIRRWRAGGRTDALAYGEALAAAIRARAGDAGDEGKADG